MENYIYGRNNVLELLQNGTRNISKIIISNASKGNPKINEIVNIAKNKGILFQFLPKENFIKFNEYSHQGVIAYVSPVQYLDFQEFIDKKKDTYKKVIITDGIEDPHNMGSIIRSAVCAGFDAIIFPSRRNATINSTVEKSSAGAVNRIDLIMVNSLPSVIDKLKDNDFWIIATDIDSKDNYYDIDYCNMNFAIVMGSENDGVSSTILKKADFRIKIPMLTDFNSLNVANAASIVIFESVKQNIQKSGTVV
jgi:23S rRNA (guanosine2251-2'-O)-methyltransferase